MTIFDQDGFDRDGFDRNGFDRDGFGRDGYAKNGFDRGGLKIEMNNAMKRYVEAARIPSLPLPDLSHTFFAAQAKLCGVPVEELKRRFKIQLRLRYPGLKVKPRAKPERARGLTVEQRNLERRRRNA